MTSAINPSTISTTFPVAGQDNDSQGFRSNFAAIQNNFTTAENEITALQTNGIDVTQTTNALQGTILSNGQYQQFSGTLYSASGVSSSTNVNLAVGAVQKFTLSNNATLTFTNWPAYTGTNVFTDAIVLINSDTNGVWTPTFATTNGVPKYDASFPATFTVGGESVVSISTTSGYGYTTAVTIGFTGGSPQANAVTPQATATYNMVAANVANLAVNGIATTGATGTGSSVTFTFASQQVIPFPTPFGQSIVVSGVTPSAYNGVWVVTNCTLTSVTVNCPAQGSYSGAGTIQGGVAGSGYAVNDLVTVAGYPNTLFTVATLATNFPGQITGGQSSIGNIPASYYSLLSVGMLISASSGQIPSNGYIFSIGSVSGGVFSIVIGQSGIAVQATGSTTPTNVIITYTSTTGPIGTLTVGGTGSTGLTYPLSGTLYQLQTVTGNGSGARAVINCGIGAINITNPGIGYTSTPPSVTITGANPGTAATATATLTSGTASKTKVVQAWTIDGGANVNIRYLGQY